MVVYDSVSADLSTDLLDRIHGSIEEKLLFLQDQLGDNFPSIVIQYVCGDDTSIVQIKGQWQDVKNIQVVLRKWLESITGKSEEDEILDHLSNDSFIEDNSSDAKFVNLSSIKKEKSDGFESEEPGQASPDLDNLCEFCGKGDAIQKPETNEEGTQTSGELTQSPSRSTIEKPSKEDHLKPISSRATTIVETSTPIHRRSSPGRTIRPTLKKNDNEEKDKEESKPDILATGEIKDDINAECQENGDSDSNDLNDKDSNVQQDDNIAEAESIDDRVYISDNRLDGEVVQYDISELENTGDDEEDNNHEDENEEIDQSEQKEEEEEEEGLQTYTEYKSSNRSIMDKRVRKLLRRSGRSAFQGGQIDDCADLEGEDVLEPVILGSHRGRKRKSDFFSENQMISEDEVKNVINEIMESIGGDKMEGKVDIPCRLCSYKTTAKRHLRAHILRCHTPQNNKCDYCGKMYSLAKDLRFHIKSHFPDHSCLHCNRKFPSKPILLQHIEKFHSELRERQRALKGMMQKCEYCDYTNSQMKNIKDHIARHHLEKTYACSKCPKKFALKKDMTTHEKAHDAHYECEECGKVLHSKIAHKAHINTIHLGIKSTYKKEHMCDHCGQICRSKTHYKEHMNKEHLNVRPFGCPLCKMAFYTNASLRSHLRTHTDDKHFQCPQCGKEFKHKTSLKMHELTHVDYSNRPFECSTCKKTFAQKGALMRHVRIHTGEKPYKCRLCEAAFSDYSILRRHMLGVHKVNSKNLCQRKDITGNRGGPKPEKLIVDDILKYKGIVRTPEEQQEEDIEEEQLLALVTKSALETQGILATTTSNSALKQEAEQLQMQRYQPIRPRPIGNMIEAADGSGNIVHVNITSNAAELVDDLKGIQPMNIVPISTINNVSGGGNTLYIPAEGMQTVNAITDDGTHSVTRGGVVDIRRVATDIQEYFFTEVKSQMVEGQDLGGLTGGYTVLQQGSNTQGLVAVSNVSDFVGSGINSLPFTVQTIPSQDGEQMAIQIIQSGI